jgi:hypothetical protein
MFRALTCADASRHVNAQIATTRRGLVDAFHVKPRLAYLGSIGGTDVDSLIVDLLRRWDIC